MNVLISLIASVRMTLLVGRAMASIIDAIGCSILHLPRDADCRKPSLLSRSACMRAPGAQRVFAHFIFIIASELFDHYHLIVDVLHMYIQETPSSNRSPQKILSIISSPPLCCSNIVARRKMRDDKTIFLLVAIRFKIPLTFSSRRARARAFARLDQRLPRTND